MADIPILDIPPIEALFPDVDPLDVPEHIVIRYNEHADAMIVETLTTARGEGREAKLRVRYPGTADAAMDTLTLDADGNIEVLEEGGAA